MSYEPTEWKAGDIVTSSKLNKIENALSGGSKIYIVDTETEEGKNLSTIKLTKTFEEIRTMLQYGVVVIRMLHETTDNMTMFHFLVRQITIDPEGDPPFVIVVDNDSIPEFTADNLNDYPSIPYYNNEEMM